MDYKTRINDSVVKRLARLHLEVLKTLDVGSDWIGDEVARTLSQGNFISLTTLYYRYNSIELEE
jgi:hypothetical protein